MVGADDSGLRSTGDDGVTLIMTYLLLFRQWMFLYIAVESIRPKLAGLRDLNY